LKLSKAELLTHLRASGALAARHEVIPRVPRERELPLSPDQESPWFLDQMLDGNPCDHLARAYHLSGSLNIAALERGINAVIERHEILRTVFRTTNGRAYQHVLEHQNLRIEERDLRDIEQDERETNARKICTEETQRTFHLGRWPLIRCSALRLAAEEWVLVLVMHHIISDGQSFDLMFDELEQLYEEFTGGAKAQLPVPPIQYADFASWRRQMVESESIADQLAYWQERFDDGATVLELPTDKPRPAVQSPSGAKRPLTIPAALCEQLRRMGRDERATLFMVLLAAFNALLYRYSGQAQIAVGTPVSMRNRPELNAAIGLVVNTLVLATATSGDLSFRELLHRVRKTVINGFAHSEVPFERLVNLVRPGRDLSHNPLFQVMLQVSSLPTLRIGDLITKPFDFATGNSQYDLSFHLYETDRGLDGYIEYDTDLFAADRIDRMAGHFEILLQGALADPDCTLAELPLLTDSERQQQLVTWNDSTFSVPENTTIHGLFEARVGIAPDAVAVRDGDLSLTFSELNRRSNRLANHLISKGVGPGAIVAVCATRSAAALAALLGILKSGNAYLPLDPSNPSKRLEFMLEDSDAALLIIEEELLDLLPAAQVPRILLDGDETAAFSQSDINPLVQLPQTAPAYIIYTSGSTGTPKGVIGLHRGSINRFHWMWERYPFEAEEICAQKTTLAFVDHVWEVFGPLLQGVPVSVIRDEVVRDAAQFVECMRQQEITRIVLVPSMLRAILDFDPNLGSRLPKLKICICSGEALSVDVAERFLIAAPGVKLLNLYGSSEVAADVTAHEVRTADIKTGAIPIGRPIFNTKLYVLDSNRQPLPVGIPGELYVGGFQLADGYLNRPKLTEAHFANNPFDDSGNSLLYRTGDLVCYRADGILNYVGRSDQQVKVRGYRVELGEIEQLLMQHPAVSEAVVTAREDVPGDMRIAAYYMSGQQTPVSSMELRDFLREKLPAYMVPSSFVQVVKWPLTPSNKVDRRALAVPNREHYAGWAYREPESGLERTIASVWRELLQIDKVGVDDNLFDLGGHSLLLLQLRDRLADLFDKELPLVEIFRYPTVRMLANYFSCEARDNLPTFSKVEERARNRKESFAKFKRAADLRKGTA
jgi:amino acid adenylation domain-containing protein